MTGRAEPFRIAVADDQLFDLRRRLAATRWPGDLANAGWDYGTEQGFLAELLDAWAHDYDWRAHEAAINAVDHFRATVRGQVLHFVHQPRPGALPLLLIGGWPQTFWDFAEVIPRLADFELVIPDLPGQGFSMPLGRTGVGFQETAEMFSVLMTQTLGHARYGVYGTDWGALIAEQMAHTHPEQVVGLHTTMPLPLDFSPTNRDRPPWAPDEEVRRLAAVSQARTGSGYLHMQSSRPQTVAYLSDSPAAMAGWLVDKIHCWVDHEGDVLSAYGRDHLLTTLSIFWFTGTLGTAARFYYETFRQRWQPAREGVPVVDVPTGVAAYPKETGAYPRAWVEQYFDLHRYTVMPRGGHFPAVESPDTLAPDIAAFFTDLTATAAGPGAASSPAGSSALASPSRTRVTASQG